MIRTVRLAFIVVLAVGLAISAHAQATPGPQLANTFTICPAEGCTVTAISSPTAVLQFGAGSTWNTLSAPTLPLLADCHDACPQVGGDPAYGVPKSLVAQEQSAAYTVTLADGSVITVPALPPPPISVTLSSINIEPGSQPTWIAVYDVRSTGAAYGFEGKQLTLTVGSVSYSCEYVSASPDGLFTLTCTPPSPPPATPTSGGT